MELSVKKITPAGMDLKILQTIKRALVAHEEAIVKSEHMLDHAYEMHEDLSDLYEDLRNKIATIT